MTNAISPLSTIPSASHPGVATEYLTLAIASSGQVVFDWQLGPDVVCFRGEFPGQLGRLPLDGSDCCPSSALFELVHPEDKESLKYHIVKALKNDLPESSRFHRVEVRISDVCQGWRWADIGGRVVERDAAGRATRMIGSITDIDKRKQAETKVLRLRDLYMALSQTNQAIVRLKNIDALFPELCRIAVEHGHFGIAWIGLLDHERNMIVPCAVYGADLDSLNAIPSPPAVDGNFQIVIRSKQDADDASPCGALAPDTVNSFASVASFPFFRRGALFGSLNLYAAEPDFFDDSLIGLLEEMTSDISFAIENYDHEKERETIKAALVENEQFKSAILTAALDAIISIDEQGHIIDFNRTAERIFGMRSEEAIGRSAIDMLVPHPWQQKMRNGMASVLSRSDSWLLNQRIEMTAMRADGTPFPVELAVVPVRVGNKQAFTAFVRDISELKQSQALLNESATRYRQVVELSPEAIFVHRNGCFLLANYSAAIMLGFQDAHDLIGRSVLDFVDGRYHDAYRTRPVATAMANTPFVEQIWMRADGTAFHAEVAAGALMHDGLPATQSVVRDISLRKRAEELQIGQNRILSMIATGLELPNILEEIAGFIEAQSDRGLCSILLLDTEGRSLVNGASPSLPGSYLREMQSMPVAPSAGSCGTAAFRGEPVVVADIAHDPLWESAREGALRHGLKACASWPIFGRNRKILGTVALYYRDTMSPNAEELQLFTICANLAGIAIESRASEERIRYLAHYDGLTSLPNRFLFKEFLDLALRNAQRHATQFAVFFVDLDKFKDINDTFGHDAGDHVLRETASRLRGCLRQTDKIARMGGDEFYILIEDLEDSRYAAEVAQKLLDEASKPILFNGHQCRLSVSIGIGIYPDDGRNGQALLKNADQAMYRAKNLGKNGYQFFSDIARSEVSFASRLDGVNHGRNDASCAARWRIVHGGTGDIPQ